MTAKEMLRLVRYCWARVRERRGGERLVWLRVECAGPREGYAVEERSGAWFAPARWREEREPLPAA